MNVDWLQRVEQETGRAAEKLARPLPGGIPVDPLFAELPAGFAAGGPGAWPYSRGATSDPPTPRACPRIDPTRPDAASLVQEAAALGARAFWIDGDVEPELRALVERQGGRIVGGADPLGDLARLGAGSGPLEEAVSAAVRDATGPGDDPLVASGLPYDAAGADPARQLAYAVATGVLYARRLNEAGLSTGDAAGRITLRLAVGSDVLASVSLLRAARVVWAKFLAAAGEAGTVSRIHAVSSARELSRRDPWVNVLRGASQAFSALTAGADWITVSPFDEPVRTPDASARRLALHTLTILERECAVGAVVDPAGGAWALEHLTDRFARAAWEELRSVEAAGGMQAALVAGEIRRRVDEAWEARSRDLARRKVPITGVSEFADPLEAPLTGEPAPPPPAAPDFPFPRRRDDDAFHALRVQADELAQGPGRPVVFLANLGPGGEHRPRTGFAVNLFRAGGFDVRESPSAGDVSPAEAAGLLAEAFRAGGADVACLCGADERYDTAAAPVAEAVRKAGAATLLLAGRPEGRETVADDFVFLGCDVPAVLGRVFERLTAGKDAR